MQSNQHIGGIVPPGPHFVNLYAQEKLLIANRGEIAVRIIHTAKNLHIHTLAIYTPSDALAPHVLLADEAVALPLQDHGDSESKAYLSGDSILSICKDHGVTLLHPGYGFLSENADFASLVRNAGITWLGPKSDAIRMMGVKHEARKAALNAGLEVVPGSEDLLLDVNDALKIASNIGYPVILKPTMGGGGMGMAVCATKEELTEKMDSAKNRAKGLFGNEGIFLERYFPRARHIEIQVFGNGMGNVVHMAERECSVQRRHQKVMEESPSPFFASHAGLREKMCSAAVELCRSLRYNSAGTIEFLVDDETGKFYFLEMNTRIQVEHPVTEAIYPGLDLVRLMILQGLEERRGNIGLQATSPEMQQDTYDHMRLEGVQTGRAHALEGRIYAENPNDNFLPCPGILQSVNMQTIHHDWLRVESWVSTGTTITPFFDPLLCKIIVTGSSREEAISRFIQTLDECKILGPTNNIELLRAVADCKTFRAGLATTRFLDTFDFIPKALRIVSAAVETTIQDLSGRTMRRGIPRSGAMDALAFTVGNALVGNPEQTEGLEIVLVPNVGFSLQCFVPCVVAVTGKHVAVTINRIPADTWSRLVIPAGGSLTLEAKPGQVEGQYGFRAYLNVRGGFPGVPLFLGSKSTSLGVGGYQGRPLLPGDQLALGQCGPIPEESEKSSYLPRSLLPTYPLDWVVHVLAGPQDDEEFLTAEGNAEFYAKRWHVSASVNRMGIRLQPSGKFKWARSNGGEGGSHPTNILDNGYAPGAVNVNGDTPVILTSEGPDMGGYMCLCTVATAEMWKLGQLSPGCTVQFKRVTWDQSVQLREQYSGWIDRLKAAINQPTTQDRSSIECHTDSGDTPQSPILFSIPALPNFPDSQIIFRQAGDAAILVEFGSMRLDIFTRAKIHLFETFIKTKSDIKGLGVLCPCIRSTLCHYDPQVANQGAILDVLVQAAKSIPVNVSDLNFPSRKVTFPIVLDDMWNREALERYSRSIRDEAVYLPSNIDYLARNNGLDGGPSAALEKLISSDWIILGVGFYFACPFLVPIDPRCRLVGQKMNPSRTFTPRGAIGIAGPVAAIYPIESPGGYQLFGRTLPAWQTWGKGPSFTPDRPWLLESFDQIHFEQVTESEYEKIEKSFDSGQYQFKIEPAIFSTADYTKFLGSITEDLVEFRKGQQKGSANEEKRERELLHKWESRVAASPTNVQQNEAEGEAGSTTVTAPLFASVWKLICTVGYVVQSADDILMILEAMKSEIPVKAGSDNIGKSVIGFGRGIQEQAVVRPGDVLVVFK